MHVLNRAAACGACAKTSSQGVAVHRTRAVLVEGFCSAGVILGGLDEYGLCAMSPSLVVLMLLCFPAAFTLTSVVC